METASSGSRPEETVRCNVCGREFDDEARLEQHVRDQGLLW